MNEKPQHQITIQLLNKLDRTAFLRLAAGYTSTARYAVHKVETHEHTTITLDLEPLAEPYTKTWTLDEEELLDYARIVREDNLSLGAFDSSRQVGIAIAEPRRWNRTLWVWELHVDPAYQGRGIGRRLVDRLAVLAKQAGLRTILCEAQNTNVPAITFYRRVGFSLEGIDLSYYSNEDVTTGEVALFMKRRL